MNMVRASLAAAFGAAAFALASFGGSSPAAADPVVITAPDYVPRGRARSVERYYGDEDVRVVRRAAPRYGRRTYVDEFVEDDPIYDPRPRRIPRYALRTGRHSDYYEPLDRPGPRYGRDVRSYRYYEEQSYEPFESRDPEVEYQPRRLAGPPSAAGGSAMRRTVDPKFARTTVPYNGPEPANSIVIDTRSRYLYLIQPGGQAIRYGVGVGKQGFSWRGTETISSKKEWPDWRPPAEMRARRPELPVMMAGGPDNPLGARALYLGSTLYRIHGSNEPWTIGHAVSSGCIRMTNEDVTDLYERVGVGTTVKVI